MARVGGKVKNVSIQTEPDRIRGSLPGLLRGLIMPPFQGFPATSRYSQGVALGWIIAAPLGLRKRRLLLQDPVPDTITALSIAKELDILGICGVVVPGIFHGSQNPWDEIRCPGSAHKLQLKQLPPASKYCLVAPSRDSDSDNPNCNSSRGSRALQRAGHN